MEENNASPEPMDTKSSDCHEKKNMVIKCKKKKIKSKNQELRKQTVIISGTNFIKVFQKLLMKTKAERKDMFRYMQRVYHAIFFFGHLNVPPIKPQEFIPANSWDRFKQTFKKPLEEYNTRLPSQTPYSILLEYITKIYGEQEASVLTELEKTNKEFLVYFNEDKENYLKAKDFALSATVITHSCIKDPRTDNYLVRAYGASIAFKGSVPRRIMIAISALYVWDKVISYAVSCGDGHGIKFPNNVNCKSYKFVINNQKYETTPPCTKCNQMYIVEFHPTYVKTNKKEDWPYGNCAETESLSNLIHYNENIRDVLTISENEHSTMSREDILNRFTAEHEDILQEELRKLLEDTQFNVNQNGLALFTPIDYTQ